jgi:hypothetical protein
MEPGAEIASQYDWIMVNDISANTVPYTNCIISLKILVIEGMRFHTTVAVPRNLLR